MQSSIRTPGCIWAKLIEQNNEKARKPESKGDAYVFFVGPRNSGKSTLINRFLYPNRLEIPKPSEGLEYTYARKPSSYDHERKDLAHIWEVGGSQEFAEEISKGDQMFLTAKQLSTAVVVVVIDLSNPSSVLSTALYWIDQVKKRLGSAYEKFAKRGFDLPEKLKDRAKNKLFGKEHRDKDLVYHSGISLVLAATKYDMLSEMDPEMKKVVARTLRFLAHANGAHLMYMSNLHASAEGRSSSQDKTCLDSFTKLMNHLIFTGLDKKPTLKTPQLDHQLPLMILAGSDKFSDIGRPKGAVDDNVAAGLQEWCELYEKMFPPKDTSSTAASKKKSSKLIIDDQFKDEEIDSIKERKMSELEVFRKDQEIAKEVARKHLLMAKAQAQASNKEAGTNGVGAKSNNAGPKASSGKAAVPALGATNGATANKVVNSSAISGQKTASVKPKTQAAPTAAASS